MEVSLELILANLQAMDLVPLFTLRLLAMVLLLVGMVLEKHRHTAIETCSLLLGEVQGVHPVRVVRVLEVV